MELLYAVAENSISRSTVISVPVCITPDMSPTVINSYLAKSVSSGNLSCTDSLASVLSQPSTAVGQMVRAAVAKAIPSVSTRYTAEQLSQYRYVNFRVTADAESSIFALEQWVRNGATIGNIDVVNPDGSLRDGDSPGVYAVLLPENYRNSLHNALVQDIRVVVPTIVGPDFVESTKNYIKSLDFCSFVAAEDHKISVQIGQTEVTLTGATVAAFDAKDGPEPSEEYKKLSEAMKARLHRAVGDLEVSEEARVCIINARSAGALTVPLVVGYFSIWADGTS